MWNPLPKSLFGLEKMMLRQDRDVSVLLLATSKLLLIVFVLLVGDQAGPGGVALGQAYILPPAYPSMVSVLPNVTCVC